MQQRMDEEKAKMKVAAAAARGKAAFFASISSISVWRFFGASKVKNDFDLVLRI